MMDAEALYRQIGQIVADMPSPDALNRLTAPEFQRWLGRAAALVEATGDISDSIAFRHHTSQLTSMALRWDAFQEIATILYRQLARAELRAPTSAQGTFIPVGGAFEVFQAISKVFGEATADVLIVDAYMDATTVTDFAVLAPERVSIRLLSDSSSAKRASLEPAVRRWQTQHGTARSLEARLSSPRALHDRLIVTDGTHVWSLTQSLKDFAVRSPGSVLRVADDVADLKVDAYKVIWDAATTL